MATVAPYGTWRSPITSDLIAAGGALRLSACKALGDQTFWLEGRPAEGGRNVIVRRDSSGVIKDITPLNFNVRTRAHEYGGGAYAVDADGAYFCNDADQRIYRQTWNAEPLALTAKSKRRYADLQVDTQRQTLIAVCEDHGSRKSRARKFIDRD